MNQKRGWKIHLKKWFRRVMNTHRNSALNTCNALITHFDESVQFGWHYHKADHGKGPIDVVDGTIKRMIFGLVK